MQPESTHRRYMSQWLWQNESLPVQLALHWL